MCIALYIPPRTDITKKQLKLCHTSNPDGCGFMYVRRGEISIVKGYFSFDEFFDRYKLTKQCNDNSPFVLHFRTASTSNIDRKACHPFRVNEDLAFVHNGNFYHLQSIHNDNTDRNLSDTQRFNIEILQKLPRDFLSRSENVLAIGTYCKNNFSKMIFMDRFGKVYIVNQRSGYWKDNVFYSNGGIEGYIGYGYSGAYYYNANDTMHKGGLLNVRIFGQERMQKWQRCELCHGYFLKEQLTRNLCGDCTDYLRLKSYSSKIECGA